MIWLNNGISGGRDVIRQVTRAGDANFTPDINIDLFTVHEITWFVFVKCETWPTDGCAAGSVWIVAVLSPVWRHPRGQRFFRHVHPRVGRWDGELHTHTDGSSVPHQRHGAQRQHPGVGERRLDCQNLGHKDRTVSPNTARWSDLHVCLFFMPPPP